MSAKFGEKLRKLRTRSGLTLEQLASDVGSSKAYIWQLENKKNAKPSAELLLRLADRFGEAPEYFLDDTVASESERRSNHIEVAFLESFRVSLMKISDILRGS